MKCLASSGQVSCMKKPGEPGQRPDLPGLAAGQRPVPSGLHRGRDSSRCAGSNGLLPSGCRHRFAHIGQPRRDTGPGLATSDMRTLVRRGKAILSF
jgi:hypothetical protein